MIEQASFGGGLARYRALLIDTVGTALRSIWANRQRAVLTALGVITGCLAFTGSYGLLWGKFESDLRELRRLGSTYVSVSARHGLLSEHGSELADQIPAIVAFSPVYSAETTMRTRLHSADARVLGAAASIRAIYDLRLTSGRFLTQGEVGSASDVAVIGAGLAKALMIRATNGGDPMVKVFGHPVRVVGVMEPRQGAMPGCGEYDTCVVMPHATLRELVPEVPLAFLAFQTKTENDVKPVVAAIRYRLRRMLGQTSFDRDAFQLHQAADVIERIEREINTGGAIIMGIVCLTLLVGGIGVMNIMLVTVVERTPEIGLRKAVGASSKEILLQFLVESVCLCTGGGVIGTAMGWVLAWALIDMVAPGVEPVLPASLILASVGFALLTGLLFGFAPAIKASRLNPIEALRRD